MFAAVLDEIARSGSPAGRPACLIAGGETTVTVRGRGRGGRCQEFALALAPELADCGTSSCSPRGPTEATGRRTRRVPSWIAGTLERSRGLGLDVRRRPRRQRLPRLLRRPRRPGRDRPDQIQPDRPLPRAGRAERLRRAGDGAGHGAEATSSRRSFLQRDPDRALDSLSGERRSAQADPGVRVFLPDTRGALLTNWAKRSPPLYGVDLRSCPRVIHSRRTETVDGLTSSHPFGILSAPCPRRTCSN